jgi:hypothetical protein
MSDYLIGERLWACDPAYERGRSAIVDAWGNAGLRLHFERVASGHFYIEESHLQEHLFSAGEYMLIATYRSPRRWRAHVLEAHDNEYLVCLEEC